MTFVGRTNELALLEGELAAVRAGQPRVVIVEGPPGIGKTTLVSRLLEEALDVRVAHAGGDEWETDVAFGVLDQLLRHGGVRSLVTGDIEAGARLLELIDELEADGPAAIVVDDAQWADPASLKALSFALRRLTHDRLLVLLTVRIDDAARLPEGLLKLADGRTGVRVVLAPLAVADLHALAGGLGVAISPGGARRLHEHSGGSPLHARALLEEVPARAWERAAAEPPAPRSFATLIAGRLADFPDDAVALLGAAAVLGMRSPLGAAASLGAVAAPFAALEAPVSAGWLRLDEGPELRFTHPLIRAAIHQHLSPAARAALHAAAAELAEDEAAALWHRVAAAAGPDAELASALEAFAARGARELRWESVTSSLLAASRLSGTRAERERRFAAAVEAAMLAGDAPRARALAAETEGFAPSAGLDNALAYVAIGTGRRAEAERRLEAAWAARGDDAALAARIADRRAFLAIVRLRAADAVEWSERALAALDDAERGPGEAAAPGKAAAPGGLAGPGDAARAAAVPGEAARVAAAPGEAAVTAPGGPAAPGAAARTLSGADLAARGRTTWWLALGRYYLGQRAEARTLLPGPPRASLLLADDDLDGARERLAAERIRGGSLVLAGRNLAKSAQLAFAAGEWDEAVVLAERAVAVSAESDDVSAQSIAGWAAVLVPAARGEVEESARQVRAAEALPVVFEAHVAPVRIAMAEAAAARGAWAEVLTALTPLAEMEPRDAIDDPGHWPWAHLYAAALVATSRDADAFLAHHERIAAERGAPAMIARLARVRGTLHAAADEVEAAERAFAAGLAALPAGMPYERALIEFAHGQLLRRSGKRGAAAAVLSDARETFAALGAQPMLERCVRELDACGLTPAKRGADADPRRLTPQERSVAQLVASRLSNRDVAAELLLSVRTIERHLTSIYRKLGVDSRVGLRDALDDPKGPDEHPQPGRR